PFPQAQPGYEDIFNPALFDAKKAPAVNPNGTITSTASFDPLNGLIRNGVNGVPLNFTTAHQFYWMPMFGFAYDVLGDGKTSLRATRECGRNAISPCPCLDTNSSRRSTPDDSRTPPRLSPAMRRSARSPAARRQRGTD